MQRYTMLTFPFSILVSLFSQKSERSDHAGLPDFRRSNHLQRRTCRLTAERMWRSRISEFPVFVPSVEKNKHTHGRTEPTQSCVCAPVYAQMTMLFRSGFYPIRTLPYFFSLFGSIWSSGWKGRMHRALWTQTLFPCPSACMLLSLFFLLLFSPLPGFEASA